MPNVLDQDLAPILGDQIDRRARNIFGRALERRNMDSALYEKELNKRLRRIPADAKKYIKENGFDPNDLSYLDRGPPSPEEIKVIQDLADANNIYDYKDAQIAKRADQGSDAARSYLDRRSRIRRPGDLPAKLKKTLELESPQYALTKIGGERANDLEWLFPGKNAELVAKSRLRKLMSQEMVQTLEYGIKPLLKAGILMDVMGSPYTDMLSSETAGDEYPGDQEDQYAAEMRARARYQDAVKNRINGMNILGNK